MPRRLKPADAESYCTLRRAMLLDSPWAFWGAPGDDRPSEPEFVAQQLADPENAILAISDEADPNRLVAAAGVRRLQRLKARHRADIWGVYCDPLVRGRGFGRAVMAAAIETARSWRGVEVVALSASLNSPEAIGLYETLGFQRWGVEPDVLRIDGRGYDEVHMILRLDG